MNDGSDDAAEANFEEPFGPVEPEEYDPADQFGLVEPEEYDPADQFGSPEHDLVPEVPTPAAAPEDVDRDLAQTWWTSVFLANVALGAPAIGLMLIYFRGQWRGGGTAVLVGLLATVALARSIRGFKRRNDADATEDNA